MCYCMVVLYLFLPRKFLSFLPEVSGADGGSGGGSGDCGIGERGGTGGGAKAYTWAVDQVSRVH